jgi:hypothetical protein
MHTLTYYQPGRVPVNSMPLPVRGQQLSRRKWQPYEREFWAADLYRGEKRLIKPTLAQSAFLTGAGSVTGVWWALQRENYRDDIMQGLLPLVPARAVVKPKAPISDQEIIDYVRKVGVARTLYAAVMVEQAAQ